ncbi:MAG TPA: hypothetical protein VFM28_01415 [Nitrososphaeraceae archaeon]|nr:hypothetical protein [Nitrososphaeraceae archaeon]
MLRYTIIEGFIILLSIIAINETVGQKNYNETITFVDPFGKFSIDYPSDWEAIAPGHRFEEGNLDLIIQKSDRQQGYIEIRDEQITSEIKKSNEENKFHSSLNNKSLEIILHSTFKDYISKLNLQNVKHIEEFSYDSHLISDLNTSSILYSFEKDDKIFYGLYILAKSDYNIIYISYIASTNYFNKNFLEVEEMINSLKFNL